MFRGASRTSVGLGFLPGRFQPERRSIVAHLQQKDALIPLPVSYYEVLQVTKDSSIEDCRMAFDELMASPMAASGYSTDCVYSRAQLLKVAADCLVDADARSHYNSLLSTGDATAAVLPGDLPGALALLQETQHPDLVIKLAKMWLEESAELSGTADVALAMAQSYCDLANEALSGVHGRVTEGYEYLAKAADVLAKYTSGTRLADEIASALADFTPAYVTERLKAPIGPDRKPSRQLALQKLKEMLWAGSSSQFAVGTPDREQLLSSLRPCLAAQEVLDLYDKTLRATPLPFNEQYDVALAGMAEGLRTGNPRLIAVAADQFSTLQHVDDVEVERAVCALLLGNPDEALEVLHLRPGSAQAPSTQVLEFVYQNGENDEDQLPAVVLLAEKWLLDVLVPEFPEFPVGFVPSLNQWGEDEQVQAYFASQQYFGGLIGAVQAAWDRVLSFFQRLAASVAMALTCVAEDWALMNPARSIGDLLRLNSSSERAGASHDAMRQLEAEERLMFASQAASPPPSLLLKCLAAALPLCALVALVAVGVTGASATSVAPRDTYTVSPPAAAAVVVEPVAVTADRAAAVARHRDMSAIKTAIFAWQEVKQQAMGPQHNVAALDAVLEGNMLQAWTTRANHVKRINWHWQYDIEHLSISEAQVIKADVVKVEVAIREKADAMFKGEVHDSYKNEYTIEYQLTRRDDNWKISGSRVTQEPVQVA